jgi:hypothetical protein
VFLPYAPRVFLDLLRCSTHVTWSSHGLKTKYLRFEKVSTEWHRLSCRKNKNDTDHCTNMSPYVGLRHLLLILIMRAYMLDPHAERTLETKSALR